MAFPQDPQTEYVDLPIDVEIGDLFEGDIFNERNVDVVIPDKVEVSQVTEATVVFNGTDDVGLYIDGALVFVPSNTSDNQTALDLKAESDASPLLAALVGMSVAAAVMTLTFTDSEPHTVTAYSPATADITPIINTADAVSQAKLEFGMGIVRDTTVVTASCTPIAKPSALGQKLVGVIFRSAGADITPEMLRLQGYDTDFLQPAKAYTAGARDMGIKVKYVGSAPQPGDDVFAIMTGADAGTWRTSSGAASQVTQGDVEFTGVEVVGLAVDALPDLTVASNTSDDQTAADLRDAWNASASHAAVAAASIDTSGAESLIVLAFVDDQVHTVVAVSPATADIVGIVNTATAVAATAQLEDHYSWARPANTTTTPPQGYLRLNR